METNGSNGSNGSNTKQEEEATPEPPKITSEVKVKDPRRVAQGKKLAAISREAKAGKAREREASIRREEVEKCGEKENYFPSYTLLPVIGILVIGGGYFFYQRKKDQPANNNDNNEKPSENSNQIPTNRCGRTI